MGWIQPMDLYTNPMYHIGHMPAPAPHIMHATQGGSLGHALPAQPCMLALGLVWIRPCASLLCCVQCALPLASSTHAPCATHADPRACFTQSMQTGSNAACSTEAWGMSCMQHPARFALHSDWHVWEAWSPIHTSPKARAQIWSRGAPHAVHALDPLCCMPYACTPHAEQVRGQCVQHVMHELDSVPWMAGPNLSQRLPQKPLSSPQDWRILIPLG